MINESGESDFRRPKEMLLKGSKEAFKATGEMLEVVVELMRQGFEPPRVDDEEDRLRLLDLMNNDAFLEDNFPAPVREKAAAFYANLDYELADNRYMGEYPETGRPDIQILEDLSKKLGVLGRMDSETFRDELRKREGSVFDLVKNDLSVRKKDAELKLSKLGDGDIYSDDLVNLNTSANSPYGETRTMVSPSVDGNDTHSKLKNEIFMIDGEQHFLPLIERVVSPYIYPEASSIKLEN